MSTFKLICVTNRALCPQPLYAQIRALCAAGIDQIILREKDLSESAYEALARELMARADA